LFLVSQLLTHGILTVHGGLHHLLYLLARHVGDTQVYFQDSDSPLSNLEVVLEVVLFSTKYCDTKKSSDKRPRYTS
jgi:hypothetical protein